MRWHSIRTECLGGTSESDHVRGLANSMTRTSDGCGASKVEPLGLPHSKPWSLDEAAAIRAELRQRVQSLVIVQEAMLDSLKNLEKFDYASEGAFLKWLTAIVENRIRDQRDFHKAARRDMGKQSPLENPRSDGSAIPLEIPDKSGLPTASQVMMLSEDMLRLEQALDHLPAETRELIIAVKLEGRTYQELADETGKTSDAVRMQVSRAMDALTAVFRELEAKGAAT